MVLQSKTMLSLLAGTMLGVGLTFGIAVGAARSTSGMSWQYVNLFTEVYERVRRDYIDEIPEDKLMDAAVRGLVADLDPYTAYMNESEYEELRIGTAGEYSGVGIEISVAEGAIKVVSAMDDSPAAHAGILGGDTIVAIDDLPVDPAKIDDSVDRMRGRPGAQVKLTVARIGLTERLDFNLVRRKVQVHSVKAQLLEPGYAYMRIVQFSETTAEDFATTLANLQKGEGKALQGLVLDLRNNPGGVLEASVEVADQFLEEGVIVTADGRAVDSHFALSATPGDSLHGAPIVILVNGGSASASEILAGALHDRQRATLMGRTTYGKGLVQSVVSLSSGGALKLTTARYLTPSGTSIQQRGIAPDIELEALEESVIESKPPAQDVQVLAALKEVKTRAIASQKAQLRTVPGGAQSPSASHNNAHLSLRSDFTPGLLYR
ncbi:MAG TPA: S41 family peptidase [Steroidobacteraceae bacterium]|nr:S41 family peptidase [Steroidobacteraceae bacterium]